MNRAERYKTDQMLRERRVVSLETFLNELEVSRATFRRDIEYLPKKSVHGVAHLGTECVHRSLKIGWLRRVLNLGHTGKNG